MEPLLIYVDKKTPRIGFIFDLIFDAILGMDYEVTTSRERFLKTHAPVLAYSEKPMDKGIWIYSHHLLRQSGIEELNLRYGHWNKLMVPFYTGFGPDLPFDIFAASFYLVTRYEEYLEFTPDRFGRFGAEQSQAHKHRFLHLPVVDIWARKLGRILQVRYPEMQFTERTYRFISTIDVDQAWAYKYKGLLRQLGGAAAAILRGHLADPLHRSLTLLGMKPDPYDTFHDILRIHDDKAVDCIFFFQVGKRGRWDKNLPGTHPKMQTLVRNIQNHARVGIHPSIRSIHRNELDEELVIFSESTGQKAIRSRQHYLRLTFPQTYQRLVKYGIAEDYSMGYPDALGFRAGTATPFPFFDLSDNQRKDLMIYPFQFMDVTLKNYLRSGPQDAMLKIESIIEQVRKVNGTLIGIWHNMSLSETGEWRMWKPVFDYMIEKALP